MTSRCNEINSISFSLNICFYSFFGCFDFFPFYWIPSPVCILSVEKEWCEWIISSQELLGILNFVFMMAIIYCIFFSIVGIPLIAPGNKNVDQTIWNNFVIENGKSVILNTQIKKYGMDNWKAVFNDIDNFISIYDGNIRKSFIQTWNTTRSHLVNQKKWNKQRNDNGMHIWKTILSHLCHLFLFCAGQFRDGLIAYFHRKVIIFSHRTQWNQTIVFSLRSK